LDNQRGSLFILRRPLLGCGLLAVIAIDIAMVAIGAGLCPGFFSQRGASTFVLEPVCVLLAYAVAVVFIAKTHGPYWDSILKMAVLFGILTGTFEVINIGIENGVPFAIPGPALPIGCMLIVFTSWGIAGFQTARSLKSFNAGLFAALSSACICMLIAVAAGFIIQFFLAPPAPAYVSTWAEFKRSGWTDAHAFGVANTLDSGFTHLLIAPIVALFIGGLASLLAQFTISGTSSLPRQSTPR